MTGSAATPAVGAAAVPGPGGGVPAVGGAAMPGSGGDGIPALRSVVRVWVFVATLVAIAVPAHVAVAGLGGGVSGVAAGAAVAAGTGFALCSLLAVVSIYEGRAQLDAVRWAPVASGAVASVNTCIGLLALVALVHEPAAVSLVAVVAAIALLASRAYGAWRERHEGLERLHALTSAAETLPPDRAAHRIVHQAADLMRAQRAEVVVCEPQRRETAIRVRLHPDGPMTEETGPATRLLRCTPEPPPPTGFLARLPAWLSWSRPADEFSVPLHDRAGCIGHVRVAG